LSSSATDLSVSRRKGANSPLRWSAGMILAAAIGVAGGACATGRGGAEGLAEAAGEPRPLPSAGVVGSRADAFVAPYVTMRDFSGTILIARAGRVLVSRGYGFADFERRVVPDERTKYGIGSITKSMTAAGIELLAAQGRLSLTDPVGTYLSGFLHGDSITVTNLLEHSSGLRDYYSWPQYASGRSHSISRSEFLAAVQAQPLDFSPGTRSAYSNSGYFLLAAIIERVSGLPYAEFIERELLRPLRMNESGDLQDSLVVRGLATGYDAGFPPSRVQPAASVSRSWLEGSGSVYASARDLYRWLRATRHETLVALSTLSYPYGWGKRTRFGQEVLEQNGRVPIGYSSYAALYRRDDLIVIVLSNIQSEVVEQMGVGLAAIALGESYEIPRLRPEFTNPPVGDSAQFTIYSGRYEIAPGFVLTVRSVAQGILIAGPDGAFLPVDHEGADRFFFRTLYVPITFERDSGGRVTALDWNGQFKAKRLNEDAGH
jgi:CubicO group peptidase (beta-lactamase class C family)